MVFAASVIKIQRIVCQETCVEVGVDTVTEVRLRTQVLTRH